MSNVVQLSNSVNQGLRPQTVRQQLIENLRKLNVAIDIVVLMSSQMSAQQPELAESISGSLDQLKFLRERADDLRQRLNDTQELSDARSNGTALLATGIDGGKGSRPSPLATGR